MSPFVQSRNVPLIRPPKGGRIGADRDEQGGVEKGGSAGACAGQASADRRCQRALAGELPAGEAAVEAISGGGRGRLEASQRGPALEPCSRNEISEEDPGVSAG